MYRKQMINLQTLKSRPSVHQKTLHRVKKQATEWKKVFTTQRNYYYNWHPRNTKNSYKSVRKKSRPMKRWAKDLNRHSTKLKTQMASKISERCSISLGIGELQIKNHNKNTVIKQTKILKLWPNEILDRTWQ